MDTQEIIKQRRQRAPIGRSWDQAAEMLASLLAVRPMVLLCKRCNGEHVVSPQLTIECICGALTIYTLIGLFQAWSSLSWTLAHLNGDVMPWRRGRSHLAAVDCFGPLRSPQVPFDTRVHLWRMRCR